MRKTFVVLMLTACFVAGGVAQGAVVFSDDFNRADNFSTLGSDWVPAPENTQVWAVVGSEARISDPPATIGGRILANLPNDVDSSAGFTLSCTVDALSNYREQEQSGMIVFAYQDSTHFWQILYFNLAGADPNNDTIISMRVTEIHPDAPGGEGFYHHAYWEPNDLGDVDVVITYTGTQLTVTTTGTAGTLSSGALTVDVPDGAVGMGCNAYDWRFSWDDFSLDGTLVPEPVTVVLLALGGVICGLGRRRHSR